jgi:hypothetical protein
MPSHVGRMRRVEGKKTMSALKLLVVVGLAFLLTSCDLSQVPALNGGRLSKEDSKAVGAACRHAGRALEDCYTLNPKTHQAGVFEGWRDMNDYMASNKIETIKPEIPPKLPKSKADPEASVLDEKTALSAPKATVHVEHNAPVHTAPVAAAPGTNRWSPPVGSAVQANSASASAPEPAAAQAKMQPQPETQVQPDTQAQRQAQNQSPSKPRPWERRSQSGETTPVKTDPKNHT